MCLCKLSLVQQKCRGKWGGGGIHSRKKKFIKATRNLFFGLLKVPMHIASSRAWQNVFTLWHLKKKKDSRIQMPTLQLHTKIPTAIQQYLHEMHCKLFWQYPCDLHFTCTCSRSIYRNYKLQLRLLKCLSAKHLFVVLHMHLKNTIPRYRQDFCR